MGSEAKRISNRRNSAGSTGPKTTIGKQRVRTNALKHGLFSRELMITDEEKSDFQQLQRMLCEQLNPATALQHVAFEKIVICCWRCKLAMRFEMRRVRAQLDFDSQDYSAPTSLTNNPNPHGGTARVGRTFAEESNFF